jgi:hypothetical protein
MVELGSLAREGGSSKSLGPPWRGIGWYMPLRPLALIFGGEVALRSELANKCINSPRRILLPTKETKINRVANVESLNPRFFSMGGVGGLTTIE